MDADWHEKGIFICYRRADTAAIAGRLRDYLNDAFPNQVFIDVESIRPGQDWLRQIRDGISCSQVVIMLVGPHWQGRSGSVAQQSDERAKSDVGEEDYVATELRLAVEQETPIIPVLIDGAEMPGPQDLPDDLTSLYLVQALEIRSLRFRQDVGRLLVVLYPELGIRSPTLLERLATQSGQGINERTRITYAKISLVAAATSALGPVFSDTWLASAALAGVAFLLASVGMNAQEWRIRSLAAMAIAGGTVTAAYGGYGIRNGFVMGMVVWVSVLLVAAVVMAIALVVYLNRVKVPGRGQ